MSCKKCNSPKTVILRQKDYYCDECFMTNTNHKFRACIGKSKILSPNENVLICFSGGVASTVLLDLIHFGISLDNTKKLRIIPFILHLLDNEETGYAKSILEQCRKYNFDVYIMHLSDYLNKSHQLPKVNCIPQVNLEVVREFQKMLKSMPPTAANDFLIKIKRDLFITFAKLLHYKYVFTAETTNTLAINLLCNIAVGRGSQIQNDISFSDIRDEEVMILRPMKDISKEELDLYVKLKQLSPLRDNLNCDNSLQSVISSFVCNLQENSQATISTVCKTADKIGELDENRTQEKCLLCKSDLGTKMLKMSALDATKTSRTLSSKSNECGYNMELNKLENDIDTTVFPFVHKYLCYGCSRNHSEMKPHNLPQHLQVLYM